jgi:hypothetical protein
MFQLLIFFKKIHSLFQLVQSRENKYLYLVAKMGDYNPKSPSFQDTFACNYAQLGIYIEDKGKRPGPAI